MFKIYSYSITLHKRERSMDTMAMISYSLNFFGEAEIQARSTATGKAHSPISVTFCVLEERMSNNNLARMAGAMEIIVVNPKP